MRTPRFDERVREETWVPRVVETVGDAVESGSAIVGVVGVVVAVGRESALGGYERAQERVRCGLHDIDA